MGSGGMGAVAAVVTTEKDYWRCAKGPSSSSNFLVGLSPRLYVVSTEIEMIGGQFHRDFFFFFFLSVSLTCCYFVILLI
jgi:hypothetical protein